MTSKWPYKVCHRMQPKSLGRVMTWAPKLQATQRFRAFLDLYVFLHPTSVASQGKPSPEQGVSIRNRGNMQKTAQCRNAQNNSPRAAHQTDWKGNMDKPWKKKQMQKPGNSSKEAPSEVWGSFKSRARGFDHPPACGCCGCWWLPSGFLT